MGLVHKRPTSTNTAPFYVHTLEHTGTCKLAVPFQWHRIFTDHETLSFLIFDVLELVICNIIIVGIYFSSSHGDFNDDFVKYLKRYVCDCFERKNFFYL